MRAINRVNRIGLEFCFVEMTNGGTRIRLRGSNDKEITVIAGIDLLDRAWFGWQNGMHLQDAFKFLSAGEREFILTGITPTEWDEMFSGEER